MTNFAVQSTVGPVISSLASKDKGSMGNKVDCAGAQLKNNAVTGLQAGAVTAGAAGGVYGVAKNAKLARGAAKVFDSIMNGFGKLIGEKDFAQKINKKVQNNLAKNLVKDNANFGPEMLKKVTDAIRKSKGALLVAAATLPILSYISHKHSYKMGQIDQKYTDKAQLQKTL